MGKQELLRGFNNEFFYIKKEITSQSDILMMIKAEVYSNSWKMETKAIFKGFSGIILALEIDDSNCQAIDSRWITRENRGELISVPVKNQLYIIDSSPSLLKLANDTDENSDDYQVIKKWNLAGINGLSSQLEMISN